MNFLKTIAKKILDVIGLLEYIRTLRWKIKIYKHKKQYPEDFEKLKYLYNEEYFKKYNYSNNYSEEKITKSTQAEYVIRAVSPQKVLVAGCAAGELVRAFREKTIETFGFDISEDLYNFAYPEVKNYLKIGSIHDIPFMKGDNFDTFVAFDVFEHIPEKYIEQMIQSITKLSPKYLITIINHSTLEEGHITLKPLKWWENKFFRYYRIKNIDVKKDDLPQVYGIKNDPEHKILVWEKV